MSDNSVTTTSEGPKQRRGVRGGRGKKESLAIQEQSNGFTDVVDSARVLSQVYVNSNVKTPNRKSKPSSQSSLRNDDAETVGDFQNQLPSENHKVAKSKQQLDLEQLLEQATEHFNYLGIVEKENNKQATATDKQKKQEQSTDAPVISKKNDTDVNEKDYTTKQKSRKVRNERFPRHWNISYTKRYLSTQPEVNYNCIQGYLRINPNYSKHAYISMPDNNMDLLIVGLLDRNRALEGDLVAAVIKPETEWHQLKTGEVQKTGTVVCILDKVHSRKAAGTLQVKKKCVYFHPRDFRLPVLKIEKSLPENIIEQPTLYKDTLFLAEMTSWSTLYLAFGVILKMLGKRDDIKVEATAILLENDLMPEPYDESLLKELPPIDYIPSADDLSGREDWRNTCVFTVDPATATDLDDAVSCRLLDNGNYEVGVHIADVTHFLKAFSPLDYKVAARATTVYLVDNVYHMLPQQLCQLCSLLPGKDKLTFSVIWEMTPDAKVVRHRFAKSIINSACQLSYEQVQAMIENTAATVDVTIYGNYMNTDISKSINELFKLSSLIRKRRFETGALRIDQPKLYIEMDLVSGLPVSYKLDEMKESNRLIEEFMILANTTVAEQIYKIFPEYSLLRSHQEPSNHLLLQVRTILEKFGVLLNTEDAGSLHNSIIQYQADDEHESEESKIASDCRIMVINYLCAKSMMRAKYQCTAPLKSKECLRHYALNVELYTHFTSPIRRYSDCVVHRLLYASMGETTVLSKWSSKRCQRIANYCNIKKYSAKVAQEQSTKLYFTYFVHLSNSVNTIGVVIEVKDKSVDIILRYVGLKLRAYFEDLKKVATVQCSEEHSIPTAKITWHNPSVTQVINVFSIVYVKVTKLPIQYGLQGIILPPPLISN